MKTTMKIVLRRQTSRLLIAATTLSLLSACSSSGDKKPDDKVAQTQAKAKKQTVPVMLGEADKMVRQDKLDEAMTLYNRVLKKEPANIDARIGIANINVKLRKYDVARADLVGLLKEQPDNTSVNRRHEGLALGHSSQIACSRIN